MNRRSGSGTAMFMMEMIMVVFFFILCASTCILIFVKGNQMSSLANDTNRGVVGAESIAEVWKAEGVQGLEEHMSAVFVADTGEAAVYEICWDADWKVSGRNETSSYCGEVVLGTAGRNGLYEAVITVTRIRDHEQLFELSTKKYEKNRE